jgi:hypothetical protein
MRGSIPTPKLSKFKTLSYLAERFGSVLFRIPTGNAKRECSASVFEHPTNWVIEMSRRLMLGIIGYSQNGSNQEQAVVDDMENATVASKQIRKSGRGLEWFKHPSCQ